MWCMKYGKKRSSGSLEINYKDESSGTEKVG